MINSVVGHCETFFFVRLLAHPDISSPVYKPTQNPLRTCISPGLVNGSLRYSIVSGATVSIFGFSCIVGICYCYLYIFSETRRQKKRLQTEQLTQEEAKRIKKDSKAANTLAFVLTALIVSYLPSIVLVLAVLTVSGELSVLLGSLVNPIIYCWRNKKLRRAFLEICHVRQPENRAPDIEMIEIQSHRPKIQPSTCEAISMAVPNQEPVLL